VVSLVPPRPALSLLDSCRTSMLPVWLLGKVHLDGCTPPCMQKLTYLRMTSCQETTNALGVKHAAPRASLLSRVGTLLLVSDQ
jgi:hypothetical protein